jgi:hypothetical protein
MVHLPPFLVSGDYKALYKYFSAAASEALDEAERLGLPREEACHNLLFATVFNSYGAMKLLLPGILAHVAEAGEKFHHRLATEIRAAVADAGGKVTMAAVEKMELTKSAVLEVLRLDTPVKRQFGRAKADLNIESHDAVFAVKKGEILFGYQPCATRDPRVFGATAGEFVGDRFLGEEGSKLLQYVYWSNGRETENPGPASTTSSAPERTWPCSSAGSCSSRCSSGTIPSPPTSLRAPLPPRLNSSASPRPRPDRTLLKTCTGTGPCRCQPSSMAGFKIHGGIMLVRLACMVYFTYGSAWLGVVD